MQPKKADPLYDKDLEENSLGCVMKSPRLIVSNELNTPRVTGCWPKNAPPPSTHPPSVKIDPTKLPGLNSVKEYLRACDFRHHKFMSFKTFFKAVDYKTCLVVLVFQFSSDLEIKCWD